MKVINERPPIWDRAIAQFKFHPTFTKVIFAWGEFIYNPNGAHVSPDLYEHEGIHSLQQAAIGGPKNWWDKYLADAKFRLSQELEAYGAQARYIRVNISSRNKAAKMLDSMARDLSGPVYGNLLTYDEAAAAIQESSMRDIKEKYRV